MTRTRACFGRAIAVALALLFTLVALAPADAQPVRINRALDAGDYTDADPGFSIRWVVFDPNRQIVDYEVRATRDAPGGAEVRPWTSAGSGLETIVDDIPNVQEGVTYFFHVRGVLRDGVSDAAVTDGIVVDLDGPVFQFIDDGEYTRSSSTLSATWDAVDAVAEPVTYAYAIGTSPQTQDVFPWRDVGTRESGVVSGLLLEDGATYYWHLQAEDAAGNITGAVADGIIVDRTAPVVTVVDQGDFTVSPDSLSATWSAAEASSGIAGYRYALGTADNTEALVPWTDTLKEGVTLEGLPLVDGEIYFFRVFAVDGAGNEGFGAADGIRVDLSGPRIDEIGFSPYIGDPTQVTITWFASDPLGVGITEYLYMLGTAPGSGDIVPPTSAGLDKSVTMRGLSLQNGQGYYATVVAVDSTGRTGELSTGEMLVDTQPPVFEFVNDQGDFTNKPNTLSFQFRAVDGESGVAYYEYSLGIAGETGDIIPPTQTTEESVTLTGLSLEEGPTYRLGVAAYDALGRFAFLGSDGIRLDVTPPVMDFVEDDGDVTARTDRLALNWGATEEGSGVRLFQVSFGRSPLQADVVPWTGVGLATSAAFEGLQLVEGETYYGSARAIDFAGNVRSGTADGIRVDLDDPLIVNLRVDSITEASATVRWGTSKPTTTRIDYGTTPAYGQVVTSNRLDDAHAVMLTQLKRGLTYYARVTATDDGGVSVDSGEFTFTTEDEAARAQRLSPEGLGYADPEILQSEGLMTFRTGLGDIWVATLDPATGTFLGGDGRELLMDSNSETGSTINGPEFGLDASGWSVFYSKPDGGEVQIWRSTLESGGRATALPLTFGPRHQTAMPTANADRVSTRVLNIIGSWETGGDIAWFDEATPGQQQVVGVADARRSNRNPGRWMEDGRRLVMVDGDSGQLFTLDTDTGVTQVITDDAGFKTAPQGFSAPEFDGATVVTAIVDDSTIGVWLEPQDGAGVWPRVASLSIPPEASYDVISSPEYFRAAGKSWLVANVKDATTGEGGATAGEIWVMDLEPDERFRYARRCDDGDPTRFRGDPEVFVGQDEVFVYYNVFGGEGEATSLWRCRTGIRTQTRHPVVDTPLGRVQGMASPLADADAWYGIPFARPPVDELRFALPAEPQRWDHVRQASRFADACPQPDPQRPGTWLGREDCLYLNIWTPAGAAEQGASLPVLFYVHGGANRTGAASADVGELLVLDEPGSPLFDGARLAAEGNVIVVTVNYRLGALGNLASPALAQQSPQGTAGNYGMYDLLAALTRTQEMIGSFGGDPSRITLVGQSAGAYNVGVLYASPLAAGRFAGVIMQSGVMQIDSLAEAQADAQAFVEEMKLADATDLVSELRALALEDIVLARTAIPRGYGNFTFFPHVDGVLIDRQPLDRVLAGLHNDVPLMLGSNADEYINDFTGLTEEEVLTLAAEMVPQDRLPELLSLYPLDAYPDPSLAYGYMVTDRNVTSSIRTLARVASTQRSPVFRFLYRHAPSTDRLQAPGGAYHGIELLSIFQHMDGTDFDVNDDDRTVEDVMLDVWSRFVTFGDPNVPRLPTWARYDSETDPYFILDVVPEATEQLLPLKSDFWDDIKSLQGVPAPPPR